MPDRIKFNRMEAAGSLGDLGTLLPIAVAMVFVNGLDPLGVFLGVGVFYILSGVYFGVTVPVQPMKVIGAYAIATAMDPSQIMASSLLLGICLLVIGLTGAIDLIRKFTPRPVIRGVQLSTGALLISGGVEFIAGTARFQELRNAAEPYLPVQSVGPVPVTLVIGFTAAVITLLLLDSRKLPAGLVVVAGGLIAGRLFGTGWEAGGGPVGFHLPEILPFGFPGRADFTFALLALVLPQLPMTVGNAVLAYTDLSREYFAEKSRRVTNRRVCVSMGLANLLAFFFGGMPMCHGAGGLAAHYRFGARTAGSNIIIGVIFAGLAILLGKNMVGVLNLLPLSVLGVLLVFAGVQLCLTIMDLNTRKEYFVTVLMLGITLASNLAAGFIAGLAVAHLLRWQKLSV